MNQRWYHFTDCPTTFFIIIYDARSFLFSFNLYEHTKYIRTVVIQLIMARRVTCMYNVMINISTSEIHLYVYVQSGMNRFQKGAKEKPECIHKSSVAPYDN